MTNRLLDDYLDDLKVQVRRLKLSEQRQVLAEIRSHLEEDIAERRKANKKLSVDEATLKATHAFGEPKDIGIAYGADGGVVRKSTGEVLLHVAVLTGRGVARTVKGTVKLVGILLAAFVVIGLIIAGIAAFVLVEYKDEIAESIPRPLYTYEKSWDPPFAQTSTQTGSFQMSTDATGFDITFETSPQTGCVSITLFKPDNSVAYSSGEGCSAINEHLHFSDLGQWRVQYAYAAFTGTVEVHAYQYRSNDSGE